MKTEKEVRKKKRHLNKELIFQIDGRTLEGQTRVKSWIDALKWVLE
jgi:hypothetical protein